MVTDLQAWKNVYINAYGLKIKMLLLHPESQLTVTSRVTKRFQYFVLKTFSFLWVILWFYLIVCESRIIANYMLHSSTVDYNAVYALYYYWCLYSLKQVHVNEYVAQVELKGRTENIECTWVWIRIGCTMWLVCDALKQL